MHADYRCLVFSRPTTEHRNTRAGKSLVHSQARRAIKTGGGRLGSEKRVGRTDRIFNVLRGGAIETDNDQSSLDGVIAAKFLSRIDALELHGALPILLPGLSVEKALGFRMLNQNTHATFNVRVRRAGCKGKPCKV